MKESIQLPYGDQVCHSNLFNDINFGTSIQARFYFSQSNPSCYIPDDISTFQMSATNSTASAAQGMANLSLNTGKYLPYYS